MELFISLLERKYNKQQKLHISISRLVVNKTNRRKSIKEHSFLQREWIQSFPENIGSVQLYSAEEHPETAVKAVHITIQSEVIFEIVILK